MKKARTMQTCETCGKQDHLAKVNVDVRVCQDEARGLMEGRLFMKVMVVPARAPEPEAKP